MRDESVDLRTMSDPDSWPQWPFLPVVRRDKRTVCGVMVCTQEQEYKHTVFLVNLFSIPKDLTTAPQESYDSFDAVISAGWEVD